MSLACIQREFLDGNSQPSQIPGNTKESFTLLKGLRTTRMMMVWENGSTSWARRRAEGGPQGQGRAACLSVGGTACVHAVHSPGSSRGHCRQMASPAPNSSWIPHKSAGAEEEGERKTEIHEYHLLLAEKAITQARQAKH